MITFASLLIKCCKCLHALCNDGISLQICAEKRSGHAVESHRPDCKIIYNLLQFPLSRCSLYVTTSCTFFLSKKGAHKMHLLGVNTACHAHWICSLRKNLLKSLHIPADPSADLQKYPQLTLLIIILFSSGYNDSWLPLVRCSLKSKLHRQLLYSRLPFAFFCFALEMAEYKVC